MAKSLEERIQLIEDREEIVRLRARYTLLNDGGWGGTGTHHDIDGLMELFTPNAVWDGTPYLPRAEGHDAIRNVMTDFEAIPFVIHNVMNPIIDVDGDTAKGDWHAIIVGTDMDGGAVWVFGKYEEDYVRLNGKWQFHHVRFVTAAMCTYEEGWAKAVARS
jgi:hypothetical protein